MLRSSGFRCNACWHPCHDFAEILFKILLESSPGFRLNPYQGSVRLVIITQLNFVGIFIQVLLETSSTLCMNPCQFLIRILVKIPLESWIEFLWKLRPTSVGILINIMLESSLVAHWNLRQNSVGLLSWFRWIPF